ncbi:MAG: M23 family metallopeptidase, partial [Rhodothermales bacterium]
MWPFLAELFRRRDNPCTIIVVDDDHLEQPRPYQVQPRTLLVLVGSTLLVLTVLILSLVIFTPLRELIPGYGTTELRTNARLAAVRLAALEDSLEAQHQYMTQLRQIMTGQIDTTLAGRVTPTDQTPSVSGELAEVAAEPNSQNWADHEQPAFPVARMPVDVETPFRLTSASERYLSSLQLPALPPVNGFLTRAFDARTGHYGVDIAVEEGTMVRAIGDGYVIIADWTHEGGYAIAVQHAQGYVSVYKHNQRLLKRVGDRVRAREA